MAYWSDVKYIDESDPGMINVNAEEFKRLGRLADTALPELTAVKANTEWDGAGREMYDRKLDEVTSLVHYLGDAFVAAGKALGDYVPELKKAKELLSEGRSLGKKLEKLLKPYNSGLFFPSEPLRQWESVRGGIFIDHDVERRADRLYDQIHQIFGDAKKLEKSARSACVAALRRAYELLPDYRPDTNWIVSADSIIRHIPGLKQELAEAAEDPHVRLPGMGEIPAYADGTGLSSAVSPDLRDLRKRADALPGGNVTWSTADFIRWQGGIDITQNGMPVEGESEKHFKLRWIRDNREVLKAAADQYGIPADVLAGVAYNEVGGKPMILDDVTDWTRQHIPGWLREGTWVGGDPDQTSYGPMAVQVRRAAEVLGYDPEDLSKQQRDEIVSSLKDPKENVFIAAQYLSNLKQSSDFALTDPQQMTVQQGQELAARYNGGPNWHSDHAQTYARDYAAHRADAAKALE
ncbi:MAG: hypothetical protein ACRDTC_00145 [Pseudonocardiaceae bacterium]